MEPKQIAWTAALLYVAFALAGKVTTFFGFSSAQGWVGTGISYGVIAVLYIWIQQYLKKNKIDTGEG